MVLTKNLKNKLSNMELVTSAEDFSGCFFNSKSFSKKSNYLIVEVSFCGVFDNNKLQRYEKSYSFVQ